MDLIEVLWKQDVDMGYSLNNTPNPVIFFCICINFLFCYYFSRSNVWIFKIQSDTKRPSNDNAYSPDQSLFASNIDEEDEIENFKKVLKNVCEDKGDKGVRGSTENKSVSAEIVRI